MSRITCKTCRRLGASICGRVKCAQLKRPYAPGKLDSERKHRSQVSEFGEQLKAKQLLRISYGLREKQFSLYASEAMSANETAQDKIAPELRLFRILESRLDNVVYRMGLAHTRALARQLVSHGHVTVNGKKTTIPSRIVKIGDTIAIRAGSKAIKPFENAENNLTSKSAHTWLSVDPKTLTAKMTSVVREVEPIFDMGKVLEFYSK
jgi:small subunit ribosomal protein S4